jgi:hypothetical protein
MMASKKNYTKEEHFALAKHSRRRLHHGQLQLTGQNLGQVFNFRFGHLQAEHFWCYQVKQPNLKLKTWSKQLLCSLPLVIALPGYIYVDIHWIGQSFSRTREKKLRCFEVDVFLKCLPKQQ